MASIEYIIDGIWLGSVQTATDITLLQNKSISAVLSLQIRGNYDHLYPQQWLYLKLPIPDAESIPNEVFKKSLAFISQAQNGNRQILVHCAYGISRSPSIVAAYLMKEKEMNPLEALTFLKNKRSKVRPSPKCFMSAVHFAYPHGTWICKNCGLLWLYQSFLLLLQDTIHCTCKEPLLILKVE
ncbi:MAG: dual specificity protein phosphatase family protein [Promethearchaeota archaeon]